MGILVWRWYRVKQAIRRSTKKIPITDPTVKVTMWRAIQDTALSLGVSYVCSIFMVPSQAGPVGMILGLAISALISIDHAQKTYNNQNPEPRTGLAESR
ncbi:MAG: hypothetical protein D6698_05000 [Gammaproteobacteria bacterium]|nr:MAG: hypothetical protein D6698_05000 [Gammaproteobacteria bacterium]